MTRIEDSKLSWSIEIDQIITLFEVSHCGVIASLRQQRNNIVGSRYGSLNKDASNSIAQISLCPSLASSSEELQLILVSINL